MQEQKAEEGGFNYRKARFDYVRLELDEETKARGWTLPISPGVVPNTNSQIFMSSDGGLVISLFNRRNEFGLHVDSVLAFARWWLFFHRDFGTIGAGGIVCLNKAASLLYSALVSLDKHNVNTHGYSDSPIEKRTPPEEFPIQQDIIYEHMGAMFYPPVDAFKLDSVRAKNFWAMPIRPENGSLNERGSCRLSDEGNLILRVDKNKGATVVDLLIVIFKWIRLLHESTWRSSAAALVWNAILYLHPHDLLF